MEIRYKIIIFSLLVLMVFSVANFCYAADAVKPLNLKDAFNTGENSPLQSAAEQGGGFKTGVTFEEITGTVITMALSLMGLLFLVLAIYGGYTWMMARGNEEMVEKAKNTLTNAIIGLVIVLAAYAISYFITSQISPQVFKETAPQDVIR